MIREHDALTVDAVLRDALRADSTGELRECVSDWAAQAWRMSCQFGADPDGKRRAELFRQLAEALRDVLRPEVLVRDDPPPSPSTRPPTPSTQRGEADRGSGIPRWLAGARDEIMTLSDGRLHADAGEPTKLWQQLHLGILSLPTEQYRQSLDLLGVISLEHLIPPQPELKVAGITWSDAMKHPLAAQTIDDWPPDVQVRYGSLRPVIATTFTVVDLAPGLFMASGQGATVTPLDSPKAQRAYQERVRRAMAQLGAADLDSPPEVDWLSALDEALRSVFPLPMPSRFSWWADRLQRSLELLTKCAYSVSSGSDVKLAKAGMSFDETQRRGQAGGDNVAIQPFRPEEDGRVLWVLRAYILLPGGPGGAVMTREGRVAYGHRQGSSYPGLPSGKV